MSQVAMWPMSTVCPRLPFGFSERQTMLRVRFATRGRSTTTPCGSTMLLCAKSSGLDSVTVARDAKGAGDFDGIPGAIGRRYDRLPCRDDQHLRRWLSARDEFGADENAIGLDGRHVTLRLGADGR